MSCPFVTIYTTLETTMKVFVVILLAAAVVAEEGLCPNEDSSSEMGRLVAHSECDKFYKCVQGEAVEMFCPDGLLFNSVFRFCDWSLNVDCGERRVPVEKVVAANVEDEKPEGNDSEEVAESNEIEFLENGCPVDPVVHWLVPSEDDCSVFFYCAWGEKIEKSCPNSLHFNRNLQVCDWPQTAECTAKKSEAEITTTPIPVDSQ